MTTIHTEKRIGILGGGPSALFMYKALIETGTTGLCIDLFEKKGQLGMGMPYSPDGASYEHITNVSGNEIPNLVTSFRDWMMTLPEDNLRIYGIIPAEFSDYRVFPRLLFGEYLKAQFEMLISKGTALGFKTVVHYNSEVTDVKDRREDNKVIVQVNEERYHEFDEIIICTGHNWPKKFEGRVDGYYDSPYPPQKFNKVFNHPVAISGSSLTAIDAIRTIARANGTFTRVGSHQLSYRAEQPLFRIVMHSIHGLLPGIRFHLEDSHLSAESLLSEEEILKNIIDNDGFLSLDYVFEKDFKEALKKRSPEFYDSIRDLNLETFVERMMSNREGREAFELFTSEYREAEKSIRKHQSIHWKEMLAVLSFAMNYPAKHFSAEDMLRLQRSLMPLISIVIAFVPQSSCEELIALHEAGVLSLVAVSKDSKVEPQAEGGIIYHYNDPLGEEVGKRYETYINAIGQPRLNLDDLPFNSLVEDGTVTNAMIRFSDDMEGKKQMDEGNKQVVAGAENHYFLKVAGIAISDTFKVVGADGYLNPRIRIMAVPYIGGYNPDYSGLDFSEEASKRISRDLLNLAIL